MINGMTQAIAALIYNSIYDLTPDEGAWCKEDPRDDQSYLAFAEQLIKVIESNPEADDSSVISQATDTTNKTGPWSWDTIVVDEAYKSLSEEADNLMPIIRHFIATPSDFVGSTEHEFLHHEQVEEEE